jgi:hypothetical protein
LDVAGDASISEDFKNKAASLITDESLNYEFTGEIISVSDTGLVTVKFSETYKLMSSDLTQLSDIYFDVTLVDSDNAIKSWTYVQYGDLFEIQLVFENPDKISKDEIDKI